MAWPKGLSPVRDKIEDWFKKHPNTPIEKGELAKIIYGNSFFESHRALAATIHNLRKAKPELDIASTNARNTSKRGGKSYYIYRTGDVVESEVGIRPTLLPDMSEPDDHDTEKHSPPADETPLRSETYESRRRRAREMRKELLSEDSAGGEETREEDVRSRNKGFETAYNL